MSQEMTLVDALNALADQTAGRRHNAAAACVMQATEQKVRPWLCSKLGAQVFAFEVGDDALSWVLEKALSQEESNRFRGTSEGEAMKWCCLVAYRRVWSWLRRLGILPSPAAEHAEEPARPSLWHTVAQRLQGGELVGSTEDDDDGSRSWDAVALDVWQNEGQQDEAFSRVAAADVLHLLELAERWIDRAEQEKQLSPVQAQMARCALEHHTCAEGADLDQQVRVFVQPQPTNQTEARAARDVVYQYRKRGHSKVLPKLLQLALANRWATRDAIDALASLLDVAAVVHEPSDDAAPARLR